MPELSNNPNRLSPIEKIHDMNVIVAFKNSAAILSDYPNVELFLRLTSNYETVAAYIAECLLEDRKVTVAYALLALGLADEFKAYLDRTWEEAKARLELKYDGPPITETDIQRLSEIGTYMLHRRARAVV